MQWSNEDLFFTALYQTGFLLSLKKRFKTPDLTKTADAVMKLLEMLQKIACSIPSGCKELSAFEACPSRSKNAVLFATLCSLYCEESLNDVAAQLAGFAGGHNPTFLHGVVVVGLLRKMQVLLYEQYRNAASFDNLAHGIFNI
jgi:hypothetical protein